MTQKQIDAVLASLQKCYDETQNCDGCLYYTGYPYPECTKMLMHEAHDILQELSKTARKQRIKIRREKEKADVDKSNENNDEQTDDI